jgi:hypothetical protein
MTPLELSVSDATILSITIELSIMILEVSFTLICDAYCKGVTYDDCQLKIIIVVKTLISFWTCSIFSTPIKFRYLWQPKSVIVTIHRCLISTASLLFSNSRFLLFESALLERWVGNCIFLMTWWQSYKTFFSLATDGGTK